MKRSVTDRIELERFLPYRLSVLTNLVSGAIADVYQQRFNLTIPGGGPKSLRTRAWTQSLSVGP